MSTFLNNLRNYKRDLKRNEFESKFPTRSEKRRHCINLRIKRINCTTFRDFALLSKMFIVSHCVKQSVKQYQQSHFCLFGPEKA